MRAHVTGIPGAMKCECGEQFILAKWEKKKYEQFVSLTMLSHPEDLCYCPFCGGGRDGLRKEEME